MKKLTFKHQFYLGLAIALLGLCCSTLFQQGIFANIGTALYGLLFVVHPIYPDRCKDIPHIECYIRLAGVAVLLLGLLTHYGV